MGCDGAARDATNTMRAQKADGAIFQAFCEANGMAFFPADPKTIRAFIERCIIEQKKPATIRRYVATIARAHIAAGLLSPCASEPVRLALKEMGRVTSSRQRQALALGWAEIKEFIKSAGDGLRADRERALLCVAYGTMARRSELVAFNFEDIEFMPNGSGTMLIRRSKTDVAAEGASAYLSHETVKWLEKWLVAAGIEDGAASGCTPISLPTSIREWRAGSGWEEILAARGGMARAAAAQRRDSQADS
jgi:integrase